jgi:hypothetical protein
MSSTVALEELTWPQIRGDVLSVNPALANIIDNIAPDNSYTVFRAKYPYGSQILKEGKMFFPLKEGGLVPFEDSRVSKNIKNKIGYTMGTNPMTMVLKNTLDLFIPIENRISSYSLIQPGSLFGVWSLFDEPLTKRVSYNTPIPLWDMTAGARSVFMLPKIKEAFSFSKIQKRYDLKSDAPKCLQDHWLIFKDIANHAEFQQPWATEIIFFSKKWVDAIHDPAWYEFKNYAAQRAWSSSQFWRNQFCWDLTFSRIQSQRDIKPCPYVVDIASHLLAMSVGAVPGFRPMIDDTVAPIEGLRKVFEEEYGSRYAPIIIGPADFNVFDPDAVPIFYSFQYHTAMKLSKKSSSRSSTLTDMYNVKSLLNKYLADIQEGNLKIDGTILYEMAKSVKFNFYHYVADSNTKMTSSNDVINSNEAFQTALQQCQTTSFPKKAPFLNGCIEITNKI